MKRIVIALLALALLLTGCQSVDQIERTVSVSGSASVTLEPDMASFSVSIEETGETTAEAQSLANAKMEEIYAILHGEYGVEAADIRTTGMSLYPDYAYIDGEQVLRGQAASQSISVTLHDISQLAPVVDSLSSVSGISLSSISLDASNKSESMAEARRLAVLDAKERAEVYAQSAGLELGDALVINESGSYSAANRIQPTYLSAMAADESASAKAAYYAGDLTVSASVSVSFEMERSGE